MGKELEDAKADMEKLRAECDVKLKLREEENKHLLLSLDEVIERDREKQLQLDALTEEAERLKAQVSILENHCLEEERVAKEKKWEGNDVIKDLEEAQEKLRDRFHTREGDWDKEKSSLLDEISRLHQSVNDGNQSVEDLKSQLNMCKQALDHEENHRKRLEHEVSEMRLLLENGSNVDQKEKSEMDLRHSLCVKDMELQDMEDKVKRLEMENQELLVLTKELQETHIQKAINPAQLTKVRSRLKALEQTHKECSGNLKAREVEWSSQAQKMTQELSRCSSDLKNKDQVIKELKKELDGCHSSLTQLKLQNEEFSLMSQLTRPEVSENQSIEQVRDQASDVAQLMEQLTLKNISLAKAQTDLRKEYEEKLVIQRELDRCKLMLEESSDCQLELMEQAAEIERKLTEELQEVFDALERLESELTNKTNEGTELEYELQSWQSVTDRLKRQFDESVTMRKGLEQSLIAQVEIEEMLRREIEEKDRRISNLEQQIFLFDQEIRVGEEEEEEEEDTMVNTVKVKQPLQANDGDRKHQDTLTKEDGKTNDDGDRQHQDEDGKTTKQTSRHIENPQPVKVASKQHDENLQNIDAPSEQNSQHNESVQQDKAMGNPCSQRVEDERAKVAWNQSSKVDDHLHTESTSKQSSQHVESSHKPEMSLKRVENLGHEEASKESSQCIENAQKNRSLHENIQTKHQIEVSEQCSKHVENTQKTEDKERSEQNGNSQQVSRELNVASRQCSQQDGKARKIKDATKQGLEESQSHQQNKVANNQSSHQDDQQSKVAKKQFPRQMEEAKKTEQQIEDASKQGSEESRGHQQNKVDSQSSREDDQCKVAKKQFPQQIDEAKKTEVVNKQTSQQSESSQLNKVANNPSSHQDDQQSKVAKKQFPQKIEEAKKTDFVNKQTSQQSESSQPNMVAHNQSSHQDDQQSKVANKQCPQQIEEAKMTEVVNKQTSQQSESSQPNKVANNQSSHQDDQQSKVAKKQFPQQIEEAKKTEVANKQTSQQSQSSRVVNKPSSHQGSSQQTEQENKQNPPGKRRSSGKVLNMAQAFESGKTRVEVEGEICVTNKNLNKNSCSRTKVGESIIDERSPFRDLNQDIFKKKATVAI